MLVIVQDKEEAEAGSKAGRRKINGMVIDVSGEAYRGQYLQEYCVQHGIDSDVCYYVSDYTSIFPKTELPAKWSDLDGWADIIRQWRVCIFAASVLFAVFFARCIVRCFRDSSPGGSPR